MQWSLTHQASFRDPVETAFGAKHPQTNPFEDRDSSTEK